MMKNFTVLDLIDLDLKDHNSLNLKCLAGRKGLIRIITDSEINRPGLTLSGFFEEFAYHRIQLFGRGEMAYLNMLEKNGQMEVVEKMFSYQLSCCVFSNSGTPSEQLLGIAENSGCAILQTDLTSSEFTIRLMRALTDIFEPGSVLKIVTAAATIIASLTLDTTHIYPTRNSRILGQPLLNHVLA